VRVLHDSPIEECTAYQRWVDEFGISIGSDTKREGGEPKPALPGTQLDLGEQPARLTIDMRLVYRAERGPALLNNSLNGRLMPLSR
jgi:hypothetical protein